MQETNSLRTYYFLMNFITMLTAYTKGPCEKRVQLDDLFAIIYWETKLTNGEACTETT